MLQKLLQAIKAVLYRMNVIKGVQSIWQSEKLPDVSGYYQIIQRWRTIYAGAAPWLDVSKIKAGAQTRRRMASLNAAGVLCSELTSLTFSEQCGITLSDSISDNFVREVLKANNFYRRFPEFLPNAYALGGGVLRAYLQGGDIKLDFISAERFIPCAWDSGRITGAVFLSCQAQGRMTYTLVTKEIWDAATSTTTTEHRLFEAKTGNELGTQIPLVRLYPDLPELATVKHCPAPLFTYLRTPYANFIDIDSPLGVSCFARAEDTLRALDVAFDSFEREFVLGRKRIIVPARAMRYVNDPESGRMVKYFDATDEAYEAFSVEDADQLRIIDNTAELRVDEHISAINALLNILCFQTGLSAGALSFDSAGGIKTATEVISQNSKTYRAKTDQQNLIEEALRDLVTAIVLLGASIQALPLRPFETVIQFDDNIIVDENAELDNHIKLTGAGLESKLRAVMDILKCNESEARAELERIRSESMITGTPDDWYRGDADDPGAGADAGTANNRNIRGAYG